jgi:hypothetical protein
MWVRRPSMIRLLLILLLKVARSWIYWLAKGGLEVLPPRDRLTLCLY